MPRQTFPTLKDIDLEPIQGLPAVLRLTGAELSDLVTKTHTQAQSPAQLANTCMQMFYVFMALGQDAAALDTQDRALKLQRLYRIAGPASPRIRLLALMAPGNMLDNTPLDFVVNGSSVSLTLAYLDPDAEFFSLFPASLPEHDLLFVAVGESAKHRKILLRLASALADWPRPVINAPRLILQCARDQSYSAIKDIAGLVYPTTRRLTQEDRQRLQDQPPDISALHFPATIRPADTHGGIGLQRVDSLSALNDYLAASIATNHVLAAYVDYRSHDGYFRKMRIVLIDSQPYLCHLAISDHWIVHYQSAGMEKSAAKRAEEALLMQNFNTDFLPRFRAPFAALSKALQLDYVTVDCAELPDGRLLIFEIDTRGLIHASDPIDLYPYKPACMQKAFDAFESMLERKIQ
jgi:hypothetical protein